MVFTKPNFDRPTAILLIELVVVALVWMFCVVPLAAQSPGKAESTARAGRPAPSWTSFSIATVEPAPGVSETADALLQQMSVAAGVIFAGQVTAVRRPAGFAGSGQDAAEGIFEIDLRVDQSLRGPAAGSTYTLREWAGLWTGGVARYKAGQRLLLFLYASDAHGLSASVHGAEGAIPLRGSGSAPGPDVASSSVAEWLVDLRWLQAQTLRKQTDRILPVRRPSGPIQGPVSEETAAQTAGLGFDDVATEHTGLPSAGVLGPDLVHAVRDPWAVSAPAVVETQPLSQVLALCQEALKAQALSSEPFGAARRRDAGR